MKLHYSLLFLAAFSLQARDCCFCAFSMANRPMNRYDQPDIHTITRADGSEFDIYLCHDRDADHLDSNPEKVELITDKHIQDSLRCKEKQKRPRVVRKDPGEREATDVRYVDPGYYSPYYVRHPYDYYPYGYYGRPGLVGGILDSIF